MVILVYHKHLQTDVMFLHFGELYLYNTKGDFYIKKSPQNYLM